MAELNTPLPSLGGVTQHIVSSKGSLSKETQNHHHWQLHYPQYSHASRLKPRELRRASIDCGTLKIGSKPSLVSLGVGTDEHTGQGIPMATTSGKSIHRRPSHKTGHHRPVLLHHLPKNLLYTPTPPSLLTSPLLNSPESPFFSRSISPSSYPLSPNPSIPISSPITSSPATTPTVPFQFPPLSFLPPFSNNQHQLAFCSAYPPSPPISDDQSDQGQNSTEFIRPNSMLIDQPKHSQSSCRSHNRHQA